MVTNVNFYIRYLLKLLYENHLVPLNPSPLVINIILFIYKF